jgi:hypothetical protein
VVVKRREREKERKKERKRKRKRKRKMKKREKRKMKREQVYFLKAKKGTSLFCFLSFLLSSLLGHMWDSTTSFPFVHYRLQHGHQGQPHIQFVLKLNKLGAQREVGFLEARPRMFVLRGRSVVSNSWFPHLIVFFFIFL